MSTILRMAIHPALVITTPATMHITPNELCTSGLK
jgi:hypothetical protein